MMEWFNLSSEDRKEIINQTSAKIGIVPTAVEKDFWAMIALTAIFNTKYKEYIVFKGGTSLSKGWDIIDRFSEDIDLGLDRSFFGFDGKLSRSKVTRLRKTCCSFIEQEFVPALKESLLAMGVKQFRLSLIDFEESDTDPLSIELGYESITEKLEYLKPTVLVEISSRSLRNPFEMKKMRSFIGSMYPDEEFSDSRIEIPTVSPSRTMLEKIFLLHEEFQKPKDKKIKFQRMTRHLYDLGQLMDTEFYGLALDNLQLYNQIVKHRKMLTKISYVNYDKHKPQHINFLPPAHVYEEWKQDYKQMQESMFYGETLSFEKLIEKLKVLQDRINNMK